MTRALVVVDVQQGFDDAGYWGPRNNPACESNIARLIGAWRSSGLPIVRVLHDSTTRDSPLHPDRSGHEPKSEVEGDVDLVVHKSVHSSFHGTPDLHSWLTENNVDGIAVCGITTSMCCETTARIGSDLGYDLWFVLDATHGFDLTGIDGVRVTADQLARSTATVLATDFGSVVDTETACAMASAASDE